MNYWYVDGDEVRFREAFHVSESLHKPIVDIGTSQGGLNGLHHKGKVC